MIATVIVVGLLISSIIGVPGTHSKEKSPTSVGGECAPRKVYSGQLIFFEDFKKLDLNVWSHEKTLSGGGNWEFQMYGNSRDNSFVKDGILYIKPTLVVPEGQDDNFLYSGTMDLRGEEPVDQCTNEAFYGCVRTGNTVNIINPVKSAKLRSVQSFFFKFGKVEVRAKLPAGDWLWPAIWLMPRYNQYSTWPSSGEIDLLESRGNMNLDDNAGRPIGVKKASSTLHWGPNPNQNKYALTSYDQIFDKGLNEDFHLYQVEWNKDGFTFSIDGKRTGGVMVDDGGFWKLGNLTNSGVNNPWKAGTKMAPFDEEFYIILNLAVGGVNGYFPDDAKNPGGKPWKNSSPKAATEFWQGKNQWLPTWKGNNDSNAFQIDYVKVWSL